MPEKTFRAAASKLLAVAAVMLVCVLMLAPGAGAQGHYKTLYRFTGGVNGSQPYAGLTFDAAGNLYGTTYLGGAYNKGTVFMLTSTPDGWKQRVLYSFTGGTDGANPWAGVISDAAGGLYGTTSSGGVLNVGTVFKLTPELDGTWTQGVLYSFTGSPDGANPVAALTFDGTGNLYGTTEYGGGVNEGTAFELTPNSDGQWTYSRIYELGFFNHVHASGSFPLAGLVSDAAGNLYGTLNDGWGQWRCCGSIFELIPNGDGSWSEKELANGCQVGANPAGGMIFDKAGNLYGTTWGDTLYRHYEFGTVFKLTPNPDGTWNGDILYTFTNGPDGSHPRAGVTLDAAGNLYGTTVFSRPGHGTVFKLTPTPGGGYQYTNLHIFSPPSVQAATEMKNGVYPYAGVILDAAENLYGTTSGDGVTTFGTVFEITR